MASFVIVDSLDDLYETRNVIFMANIDDFPSLFTPNAQGDFPWDHPSWTDAGMSKIEKYQVR